MLLLSRKRFLSASLFCLTGRLWLGPTLGMGKIQLNHVHASMISSLRPMHAYASASANTRFISASLFAGRKGGWGGWGGWGGLGGWVSPKLQLASLLALRPYVRFSSMTCLSADCLLACHRAGELQSWWRILLADSASRLVRRSMRHTHLASKLRVLTAAAAAICDITQSSPVRTIFRCALSVSGFGWELPLLGGFGFGRWGW